MLRYVSTLTAWPSSGSFTSLKMANS
jgi:hypothetical protein